MELGVSFIVALGISWSQFMNLDTFGLHVVVVSYVEKFSIGFGKSIWSKVGKDGTEYSVSIIPLGGYVKMLDSRVDEGISEQDKRQVCISTIKSLYGSEPQLLVRVLLLTFSLPYFRLLAGISHWCTRS